MTEAVHLALWSGRYADADLTRTPLQGCGAGKKVPKGSTSFRFWPFILPASLSRLENVTFWGWRDDSAESERCPSRGPEFNTHQLHGGSHLLMGSNSLFWYAWKGSIHIHKINKPLKKEEKKKILLCTPSLPSLTLATFFSVTLLGSSRQPWFSVVLTANLTPLNIPIKRLSQQHPTVTLHGIQSTALQTGEYLAWIEVQGHKDY